ncbi:MAG: DUF401 family protein [Euryarchaeota archaeon]|nr:DUF401 family protein [Euryarchaeota archaeon]
MFWTLLGVLIAFALVVILIRRKISFGLSLFVGALIVGVFSLETITLVDIPKAIIEASIYSFKDQQIVTDTIELAVLTTLIYMLAKALQETGSIKKLIDSLRTSFSKGGTLGFIPAVYGLMPLPGGAILSAPMVDEEGDKFKLDKNQKNLINIWFRHIWEPMYPVTAAMILICSVKFSNINIYTLMFINVPACIVAIIIGVVLLKKFIKNAPVQKRETIKNYRGLIFLLPAITPLFFYAVLQYVDISQTRSFLLGIIFSIILLFFLTKLSVKEYLHIIKKSFTWKLIVAIFGIMIFREMFETTGANVMIANLFGSLAVPALAMIVFIPFLLGLLTGYNLGAIALSYFLVEPFFAATGLSILGLTSVVFISALVGYLISPIHLCNVLSSDYLKTDPTRIYKWFIPAALCMLVVQVGFVVLFYRFLG